MDNDEKLSFQDFEIRENPCSSVAFCFCFFERSPKMAVPTRTSVAPSSTATMKSFVIPMESCGSFRSNSFSSASRNSRNCTKKVRDGFRFFGERRN